MSEGISASRFYMWRAVVAMAHADDIVTPHEVHFLQESMKDVDLNAAQMEILSGDLGVPQDIYMMFSQITEEQDQKNFFKLARIISWSDGDFDAQERHIIEALEKIHMNETSERLLNESKNEVQEIALGANQWTEMLRNKGVLSLLEAAN